MRIWKPGVWLQNVWKVGSWLGLVVELGDDTPVRVESLPDGVMVRKAIATMVAADNTSATSAIRVKVVELPDDQYSSVSARRVYSSVMITYMEAC